MNHPLNTRRSARQVTHVLAYASFALSFLFTSAVVLDLLG